MVTQSAERTTSQSDLAACARQRPLRVASVSYLNARPLIEGLEHAENLRLTLAVPSELLNELKTGEADVALLPVIDYQRLHGLRVIPAGAIGCDGPTLTVRIFSREPIEQLGQLACDPDSHTSVALARIILAEVYGIRPEFLDLRSPEGQGSPARLLIGDKVVCEEPPGFEHQLDLGAAWKQMTGLPFVFAIWTARPGVNLGDLCGQLEASKRRGLASVNELITRYALPRGWPAGMALQYLTVYLKYDVGEPQLQAIRRFHELAARYELVPNPPRPLVVEQ